MLSIIKQAQHHSIRTAVIAEGKTYTYQQLLDESAAFAALLLTGTADLAEARVAFMVNPGFDYVKVQWGIWQAGGIAVPLCLTHPLPSLQYVIEDTQASILVVSAQYQALLHNLAAQQHIRFVVVEHTLTDRLVAVTLPNVAVSRKAMILYTSGTTNKPKGVVSTHANLEAQISTLVKAWEWSVQDSTVCVLPLHHVHGIVNVVSCAFWSGASCVFLPSFSAEALFALFQEGVISVFMAVPTVYFKLIAHWEALLPTQQHALSTCMAKFRLMVCGSAALPVSIMEKWERISGHRLLERYGMTEVGMAISNPYRGERRAGYIGQALPGVQVRLANEQGQEVPPSEAGEIWVKGANVFQQYWQRPQATQEAFTADGWFKTGDVAVIEDGYYRILGRSSVDIIKSGGYKISALEIEEVLRTHPHISDCAVVGIENEEWGELVVAAIICKDNQPPNLQELDLWMRATIAGYKIPRKYLIVPELPRNAMGKVTKNEVKKLFL